MQCRGRARLSINRVLVIRRPTDRSFWVNRKGHEEKTNAPPGGTVPRALSPDNTRLAITVGDPDIEIAIGISHGRR